MSPLIENLLKVKASDHRKIQEKIKKNFESLGYEVKLEKKIWAGREGKIDVFAKKGNYTMGLEVDHCQIRNKSIEKLNALKPSLAIFFLKAKNLNRKANDLRAKQISVNSLLIHLASKQVEKIGQGLFERDEEKIPAVPTLIIFKSGKPVEKAVGLRPKKILVDRINLLINQK